MRSFGRLTLDTLTYFTAIAEAKYMGRDERLKALEPMVGVQYKSYAESVDELAGVTAYGPLSLVERDDLLHCYGAPTQALLKMLGDIEDRHRAVCPAVAALCQYCGLNHDASDWDHYLPQAKFPEFSVLTKNLVPCCGRCNGLKGDEWIDGQGRRRILSFYYDKLPTTQFLHAVVRMDGAPVAEFTLSSNVAAYGGLESTVRHHFTQLQLLQRFSEAAPNVFSEMEPDLGHTVKQFGTGAAALMLNKKAISLSASHSPNYWKVPLYQAMAGNDDYMESLGG